MKRILNNANCIFNIMRLICPNAYLKFMKQSWFLSVVWKASWPVQTVCNCWQTLSFPSSKPKPKHNDIKLVIPNTVWPGQVPAIPTQRTEHAAPRSGSGWISHQTDIHEIISEMWVMWACDQWSSWLVVMKLMTWDLPRRFDFSTATQLVVWCLPWS